MKANAPEMLYLSKNIYSTYLYQVPDPDDETAVEYVRKDAFIEKMGNFLSEKYLIKTKEPLRWVSVRQIVEDFKKYMEGE